MYCHCTSGVMDGVNASWRRHTSIKRLLATPCLGYGRTPGVADGVDTWRCGVTSVKTGNGVVTIIARILLTESIYD